MGRTVCQAVADDPELELVAAIDPHHEGLDLRTVTGVDVDLAIVGSPDGMPDDVEVVVDFTEAEAARGNLAWCAERGVHAVVGTTGLTDDDLGRCRDGFTKSSCLIAPNFAIGAVLTIRLSELAAKWFDSVEVVEMHHDRKVDAPSGTAVYTAERIAAVRKDWAADPTQNEVLPGARGGEGAAGIRVHALRVRGAIATQEVVFGTTGQTLSIRHETYDRTSFMPGVLLAVKQISHHPGLTVGLDSLLDL